MPGKNSFIPGFEVTSYFPDPIEISFVGSGLTFTPGVPTEDGWYVCKVLNAYCIVQVRNECTIGFKPSTILSHAKPPEL